MATKKTRAGVSTKEIRVGVVGYGGAFNMGRVHLNAIVQNKGFVAAAVCDPDTKRLKVAEDEFPGIKTFTSVTAMLKKSAIDLAIIITPHSTHAPLVLQCLRQGVHAVCEKPLAISDIEAREMLRVAKKKKVMLSAFHNRRWDGDYVTLKQLIAEKRIGRIFRIDCHFSNYNEQSTWWRAYREVSGGAIFDWGAHFTDWILNLVPSEIAHVTGFQVKHPDWQDYDNEDHSEYTIRFVKNCQASLTISNMAMDAATPRWRILGENGAIVHGGDHWLVRANVNGRQMEMKVPFCDSDWDAYYRNIADHLIRKRKLIVTPESAARVIGVLYAAGKSAAQGGSPVKPMWT